jgi:catechol 2,3-dioxygenase-like lactoylglutathione lyase family enzyme
MSDAARILGLRTALVPTTDLLRGKEWYSKVLGQEPYFDEPFYVGYAVGGFELGLLPDGTPGTPGATPVWGVANADAAVARLIDLGATLHEKVNDVGGGIRYGSVLDPFGNVFAILENPHFKKEDVQ